MKYEIYNAKDLYIKDFIKRYENELSDFNIEVKDNRCYIEIRTLEDLKILSSNCKTPIIFSPNTITIYDDYVE